MKSLWIRLKPMLRASLESKHLPLTILAILSAISLLSRVILLLR